MCAAGRRGIDPPKGAHGSFSFLRRTTPAATREPPRPEVIPNKSTAAAGVDGDVALAAQAAVSNFANYFR
jgi:hypothetical protein